MFSKYDASETCVAQKNAEHAVTVSLFTRRNEWIFKRAPPRAGKGAKSQKPEASQHKP